MKTDSMLKRDKHILFVEPASPIYILVFAFPEMLKDSLIKIFTQKGCSVITGLDEAKKLPLSYIFHFHNLQQLAKTMNLAHKNNCRFIFITTKKVNRQKIDNLISGIAAGVPVSIFTDVSVNDYEAAKKITLQIIKQVILGEKEKTFSSPKPVVKKPVHFQRLGIIPLLFLIVTVMGIYCGSIFASLYFGIHKLEETQKQLKNGNINQAYATSGQALKFISAGNKLLKPSLPVISFIFPAETKAIQEGFNILLLLTKDTSGAIYVIRLAQSTGESIISSRTNLHQSQLETLQIEIGNINQDTATLIAQIRSAKKINSKIFKLLKVDQQLDQGEKTLVEVNKLLSLSKNFTQILPQILGYENPKTFLLLFQNNAELRPTGGFIGSFGWLTFANGRLIEFKTEDVYTADGQLKGHIPPPEAIKKYLNQENWYFRDSNFDPDFAVNSQQAEWFLKKEMNLSFDGVFAFDLNSVAEILRGVDGVYLPDYKEQITADNLFLKTQTAVEEDFFPGSTQKRDFIGSLTRNLFIKLTSGQFSWVKLLTGLKTSLDQKHVLLYFHNETAQQLIEQASWGGRVASVSCVKKNCVPDYLMLVEANLGINKANFLIDRQAKLRITKGTGSFMHELLVNYTNESPEQVYPGGAYFSYSRILLPKEAEISELSLSEETIPKEEITQNWYQDKRMIGFPVKIPTFSKRTIRLVYNLPVSITGETNLELLIQKQPGIKNFPLEIETNNSSQNSIHSYEISGDNLISIVL